MAVLRLGHCGGQDFERGQASGAMHSGASYAGLFTRVVIGRAVISSAE